MYIKHRLVAAESGKRELGLQVEKYLDMVIWLSVCNLGTGSPNSDLLNQLNQLRELRAG